MYKATRQTSTIRRLSGTAVQILIAALVLSAGVARAQQEQPAAPPPVSSPQVNSPQVNSPHINSPQIKGVMTIETSPPPAPAKKPAAHAKTLQEMLYLPATPGASDQKGKLGEEGVKMHGHWVIDVKNPDGKLASHHDFENSIQAGGMLFLLNLLAGYAVPGDYAIYLQTAGCHDSATANDGCVIVRTTATQPGVSMCASYICNTGLTYTYHLNSTPFQMVLGGQVTANATSSISGVGTYFGSCPYTLQTTTAAATITPADCPASTATSSNFNELTGTTLATPIAVTQGQVITVTVTISFS